MRVILREWCQPRSWSQRIFDWILRISFSQILKLAFPIIFIILYQQKVNNLPWLAEHFLLCVLFSHLEFTRLFLHAFMNILFFFNFKCCFVLFENFFLHFPPSFIHSILSFFSSCIFLYRSFNIHDTSHASDTIKLKYADMICVIAQTQFYLEQKCVWVWLLKTSVYNTIPEFQEGENASKLLWSDCVWSDSHTKWSWSWWRSLCFYVRVKSDEKKRAEIKKQIDAVIWACIMLIIFNLDMRDMVLCTIWCVIQLAIELRKWCC